MVRAYEDYKGPNTQPTASGPTGRWGLPMYYNTTTQAPAQPGGGAGGGPTGYGPQVTLPQPGGGAGGGPTGYGPQVTLPQPGNPNTYTSRQTDAAANQAQAQAHRQGDPRAANKAYQRAGLSSSKGTQGAGAADASRAYSENMAASEQARMGDAYANANLTLNSDVMRNQFGQALAGLNEEASQMQYMQNMRNMQNATSFMGNLFGTMTQPLGGGGGGGSGMLGQLLGGLM